MAMVHLHPQERRNEVLLDTLRRFARRRSRTGIGKLLAKVRPEDVAVVMRRLTPAERQTVFTILSEKFPDTIGDVLTELDESLRIEIFERLSRDQIAAILGRLEVDDAVFLVESLPPELEERVLEVVDVRRLEEVQSHLGYAEDSAGRIMTTEFFALPATATVREAVEAVQSAAEIEMIFYLYVVDANGHLVGVTSLRQLLLSSPSSSLGDIAQREVISVHPDTDQEEVAQLSARYDLLAIPVVDGDKKLLGIVTFDDIVDVVKEEATEDFYKMAGTSEDELLYQARSWRVAGLRLPWLLVNMAGLLVTGVLLERFQVGLKEALFLLYFVPVITGMAGSSGTQTSMITVRGLATGRIAPGHGRVRQFLWQQLKVGGVLGGATGVLAALVAIPLESSLVFPLVVGLSLCAAIIIGSLSGAMIPLAFRGLGIDPAVAAGPLVTATSDILGIAIYFSLATLLIHQLLVG